MILKVLGWLLFLSGAISAQQITVTSISCDKTAFAFHGDVITCTAFLSGNTGSGGSVTPYAVDSPGVLSPVPVTGILNLLIGAQKVSLTVPASLTVAGGLTSVKVTVTWP